jgi:SAM-dependent MidA family methyltransferase
MPQCAATQNVLTAGELIAERIAIEGCISFRDFMELALYAKDTGYYCSGKNRVGKCGDFFTTPAYTCLHGMLIARQLSEMWRLCGKGKFAVVEYAAGDGKLKKDILDHLKCADPEFFTLIDYHTIEKNGSENSLTGADEIEGFIGCVLSNELVDNFPVHRVEMQDELMEVFIIAGSPYREKLFPASKELREHIEKQNIRLPRNCRTEINFAARGWLEEISRSLYKGFVMTIDYGYESAGHLYSQAGSVRTFHDHACGHEPLEDPGSRDITADVDFTALQVWGEELGLASLGLVSQGMLMRGLGISSLLRMLEQSPTKELRYMGEAQKLRFLQVLMLDMGNKFKVLIQQKGFEQRSALSGMQFARRPAFSWLPGFTNSNHEPGATPSGFLSKT